MGSASIIAPTVGMLADIGATAADDGELEEAPIELSPRDELRQRGGRAALNRWSLDLGRAAEVLVLVQ